MAQDINLQSPGITTREIDLSGPRTQSPTGIPAGIVGTSLRGPAFVPVTLANMEDFVAAFGTTDGEKAGPYAVNAWLRNARAVTFFKVLGIGDGKKRVASGANAGRVKFAGFVVGAELPNGATGALAPNPHAVKSTGGGTSPAGRTYFLGALSSSGSSDETMFADAGMSFAQQDGDQDYAQPIIRGVVLAPSGVILRLSSSNSAAPATNTAYTLATAKGKQFGAVDLSAGKQEFVMLLNGYKGDAENSYATAITASFDVNSKNYFANVLNTDPTKLEEKGHLLYASYDLPVTTVLTGSKVLTKAPWQKSGFEPLAFLATGSEERNSGTATAPNFENFEDRFATPQTPFFISQNYGGTSYDLFRIISRDDGAYSNAKIKIVIGNLTPSTDPKNDHGTFSVSIRQWEDHDGDQVVLEDFPQCSLDPSSQFYIAKVIGDINVKFNFEKNPGRQKLEMEGSFPNQSNYVRVKLSDSVLDGIVPDNALPVGFRGHDHLVTSGSAPLGTLEGAALSVGGVDWIKRAVQPPVPFRRHIQVGTGQSAKANNDLHWGVHFELPDSATEPNKSLKKNRTLDSMAKYFPNFQTGIANMVTGSNHGQTDTSTMGVLDADRFNNNKFTLENIKVVTNSNDEADISRAKDFRYVRAGGVATSATERAFDLSKDLSTPKARNTFKFITFMQGGFDGVNIFNKEMANLTDISVKAEQDNTNRGLNEGPSTSAYNKAITIMKNTADVDIKLFAIPGIRHKGVTDPALEAMKDRFDALYIMDIEERDASNAVITGSSQNVNVTKTVDAFKQRTLDTSFAAAYFPDCDMVDDVNQNNGVVTVPASVAALGAYSLNDSVGREWFAPAGVNRGQTGATKTRVKLNQKNLDTLYSADVNPIVELAAVSQGGGDGVIVWGQKTALAAQTSLDRVNVRRLLINIRRQVRDIANTLLFEPNRASTLARFKALVEPRLAAVQQQQGIERFKVVIDTTTTTQADVENNTIRGKIFLQPTKTAEFVALDFVVESPGTL